MAQPIVSCWCGKKGENSKAERFGVNFYPPLNEHRNVLTACTELATSAIHLQPNNCWPSCGWFFIAYYVLE